MRDETLRRLDEIIATAASVIAGADCGRQAIEDDWPVLRAELNVERCENCQLWDSDPPSAPDVKIPEKTYARVCFGLTLQDVWNGDFMPVRGGAVLTKAEFCCSHFEAKKEPKP
jgi:hypothetical protein